MTIPAPQARRRRRRGSRRRSIADRRSGAETGYTRDYSEGAAYRDYFATDRVMFRVSRTDGRLRNKAEVLVMRLPDPAVPARLLSIAIDGRLLRKHPVYSFAGAAGRFIVVTSGAGANRVFHAGAGFGEQRAGPTIRDMNGDAWRVTESGLVLDRDPTMQLPRVSAQRAFWFGWYAQFPETELIKE